MLRTGELRRLDPDAMRSLYPQLWALADFDADAERGDGAPPPRPSDGTALWWAAAQAGAGGGGVRRCSSSSAASGAGAARGAGAGGASLRGVASTRLADEALALWHARFTSGESPDVEALDDGTDEYDYGSDEDFPGATG